MEKFCCTNYTFIIQHSHNVKNYTLQTKINSTVHCAKQ